ncbi:MAG: hypothetical protein BWK80_55290, partial [Desulfobacteraceae bacterium IS3]
MPNGTDKQYYLIVKTDNEENVAEINKVNNIAAVSINVTLTTSPDLQITELNVPADAKAGQPITVSWKVENKGQGNITVSTWYDAVYLSSDSNQSNDDIHLASFAHNSVLNSSGTYTVTQEVEIPNYASGYYYLLVKTDSRDDIYEHNTEGNNVSSKIISVTLPQTSDLVVTDVTVPTTAIPGETVTISWTIRNQGTNP